MARQRIVAELGRPETPEETAARKAAASQRYRSSKTFQNLIAALIVCVGVVAVVVLGVPRGTPEPPAEPDVAVAAASAESAVGRPVVVPDPPEEWRVNSARIEGGMWRIVYAPKTGFVRVSQALDAPQDWASQTMGGFAPNGSVTIDGIEWDVYDLPTPVDNLTYGIAADAGADTILIYGSMSPDTAARAAEGLGDQIRQLREDAP